MIEAPAQQRLVGSRNALELCDQARQDLVRLIGPDGGEEDAQGDLTGPLKSLLEAEKPCN